MFPSRSSGGGSRFQNGSNWLPVRSDWEVAIEPGEVAADSLRVFCDLGLVESEVVADVEGVAADRDRLPELDGQLILEQADRHPLDRDRLAVVRVDPSSLSISSLSSFFLGS